jgi:anaerobic dimethyl sulfoxide reductase subunit C (anchor subunit)
VTLAQSASLPAINSSIKQAAELSPDYAGLMAFRFLLLFAALGLWRKQSGNGETLAVSTGVFCVILAMLGEMIGRGVFYGLYMTSACSDNP